MFVLSSVVACSLLVLLPRAAVGADEGPFVRVAVHRYFAVARNPDLKMVRPIDESRIGLLKSVTAIGDVSVIRLVASTTALESTTSRRAYVRLLLNRGMESLAFDACEKWALTQTERIDCLCCLNRLPSATLAKQMLATKAGDGAEPALASVLLGFLSEYDIFVAGVTPDFDEPMIRGSAIRAEPVLAMILETVDASSALFTEAFAVQCCCLKLLAGTESEGRLRLSLHNQLAAVEDALHLCAMRGWSEAFEVGCALLPSELCFDSWQLAFSSRLSVVLRFDSPISAGARNAKVEESRHCIVSLLTSIANGQRRDGGMAVEKQLEMQRLDQIPVSLFVCFEAARLTRDAELLKVAIAELDGRLTRGTEMSPRDVLRLRIAAAKAAVAVSDLLEISESTGKCIALLPLSINEAKWNESLYGYTSDIPCELELALINWDNPRVIREITAVIVRELEDKESSLLVPGERRANAISALGGLWVLGGADRAEFQRIRRLLASENDTFGLMFGMGSVAGANRGPLSPLQIWYLCSDANLLADPEAVEFFLSGVAERSWRASRWSVHTEPDWSTRLLILLDALRNAR